MVEWCSLKNLAPTSVPRPFELRYGFGYALHHGTNWKFTSFLFSRPEQLEKDRNDLTNTIIRAQHVGSDVQVFLEEAEMLAQLQHPQLPQLVDYFASDTGGFAYLVMDYIQGPTLQDLFERGGRELAVDRVVHYSLQLCELFHYLHSFRPKAIIYRDLKPSNVMINEHDRVRLIDFGVARHFTLGKHADTLQLGTIGFAAPEQLCWRFVCRCWIYLHGRYNRPCASRLRSSSGLG